MDTSSFQSSENSNKPLFLLPTSQSPFALLTVQRDLIDSRCLMLLVNWFTELLILSNVSIVWGQAFLHLGLEEYGGVSKRLILIHLGAKQESLGSWSSSRLSKAGESLTHEKGLLWGM